MQTRYPESLIFNERMYIVWEKQLSQDNDKLLSSAKVWIRLQFNFFTPRTENLTVHILGAQYIPTEKEKKDSFIYSRY